MVIQTYDNRLNNEGQENIAMANPVSSFSKRSLFTVFFGISLIFVAVMWAREGEVIQLRASDNLNVVKRLEKTPSKDEVVGVVQAGKRANVIGCESTKSDIVVQVRLDNGTEGYIALGRYKLERKGVSINSLISKEIPVFSCKGILLPISEKWPGTPS